MAEAEGTVALRYSINMKKAILLQILMLIFVAAPQYGFLRFVGASKKNYNIDLYASDVVNKKLNFDDGAGANATSETFWTPPEDVVLVDAAIHTGMTDTTFLRFTRGGVPMGNTIRYAAQLDTSDARVPLAIGFRKGINVGAIQFA